MVTHILILAGLTFGAARGEPVKEPAAPANTIRLELELSDGSRLFGEPVDATMSLELHTRFGDIAVPLNKLERFEIQRDGERIIIHWSDGDRLTAFARFRGFALQTLIGQLTVPLPAIRRGTVHILEAEGPLKPVGIKVSGAYAHQTPDKAFDGSKGSAWSSGDWKGWMEVDLGAPHDLASVQVHLQFSPPGAATHEVYVSERPMGSSAEDATLLQRFSGHRKDGDALVVRCPPGVVARYVQVRCPSSRGWFNIRELEIFAR